MNILAVIFHFPPMSGGGVVVAVELINNFVKMGHKVTVITPELQWDGPIYDPKIEKVVRIIRIKIPSQNKIKVAARRCKGPLKDKINEISKECTFDFIFSIFHPFHMAPHAAIESAKILGIPSLIKIDDAVYQKATGFKAIQRRIEKVINSKALKNATKLFVVNEPTKKLVNKFYDVPNEKISVIPNGVDIKKFYHKDTNYKTIVFTGAMYHHRGIDILINAIPKIIKKFPEIKFSLIGEGPELSNLKKLAKEKKVVDNVSFEGWIDREEIPKKLANSIIGIGPLRETEVTQHALPIKVLEYMSASLPIIATKNTLPLEILKDSYNGYFINNANDLSEKIIYMLSNDKIRKILGKNSRKIVEKYDWQNITSKILNEFKNIN